MGAVPCGAAPVINSPLAGLLLTWTSQRIGAALLIELGRADVSPSPAAMRQPWLSSTPTGSPAPRAVGMVRF